MGERTYWALKWKSDGEWQHRFGDWLPEKQGRIRYESLWHARQKRSEWGHRKKEIAIVRVRVRVRNRLSAELEALKAENARLKNELVGAANVKAHHDDVVAREQEMRGYIAELKAELEFALEQVSALHHVRRFGP